MTFDLLGLIVSLRYIGLFAAIFAGSGLFAGFLIPGDTLLFTAGLLASQHFFTLSILIVVMGVGAMVGDNLGYEFGSRYGHRFLTRHRLLFLNQKQLRSIQDFFEKFGPRVMLFSRFIPGLGTFGPFIAGSTKMKRLPFVLFAGIGAFIWVTIFTLLGYFFGSQLSTDTIEKYLFLIVIGILFISFIPSIINHTTRYLAHKKEKRLLRRAEKNKYTTRHQP
ncbi:MAG: DedA family protein [Patescibacteria group bacterium]